MSEVVTLSEAAGLLGLGVRGAESALRRAGVRSGYPRDAVLALAASRDEERRRGVMWLLDVAASRDVIDTAIRTVWPDRFSNVSEAGTLGFQVAGGHDELVQLARHLAARGVETDLYRAGR